MKQEDRQKLFDKLMEGAAEQSRGDTTALKLFSESTTEDLDKIEPLIDTMLQRRIILDHIEAVRLLVFLRFHEWHEARPGYARCPDCHIEFQASLPTARHHRPQCQLWGMIRILQEKITTYEGSKNAVSANTPST